MFTPAFSSAAMLQRKQEMPVINADKPGNALAHPAPKAPRIFADTATWSEIEPLFKAGIINGLTTNPSLLKKAGAKSWGNAKEIMKDLCAKLKPFPVSLELLCDRVAQALGDQMVAVEGPYPERAAELPGGARLAGPHEADQDECHPMRCAYARTASSVSSM